jgi:hypothetical protein
VLRTPRRQLLFRDHQPSLGCTQIAGNRARCPRRNDLADGKAEFCNIRRRCRTTPWNERQQRFESEFDRHWLGPRSGGVPANEMVAGQ